MQTRYPILFSIVTLLLANVVASEASPGADKKMTEVPGVGGANLALTAVPEAMHGFRGEIVGRLIQKNVEKGSLQMQVQQISRVWKNNTAKNPQSGVGRVLALDGVFGRFLDELLLIDPGDRFVIEARHVSGDQLQFLGEQLSKVANSDAANWRAGLAGFRGMMTGTLMSKNTELGTFKFTADGITRVWKQNKAPDPLAAMGKTLEVRGVSGRWLDTLLLLNAGDPIEVEAFQNRGNHLDFVGEWLKKLE